MKSSLETYQSADVVDLYANDNALQKPEAAILEILRPKLGQYRMLDIGVGGGRTALHFAPLAKEYVGVDFASNMVDVCRARFAEQIPAARFETADARDMSAFADGSFDLVLFSFNGIDTVSLADRLLVLAEVRRVLRPEGLFCFSSHNKLHLPELFGFIRPAQLRHFPGQVRRLINIHRKNHPVARKLEGDFTVVYDGVFEFREQIAYIHPASQLRQLAEFGFRNVRAFDHVQGREIATDPATLAAQRDAWIYYLCERDQGTEPRAGTDRTAPLHLETSETLDADASEEIERLFAEATHPSYTHDPAFLQLVPARSGKNRYCFGRRGKRLVAFAVVNERNGLLARLRFGPLYTGVEDCVDFLVELHDHYRDRRFLSLSVQLYEPTGGNGELITYRTFRRRPFSSPVDEVNWSTIVVPLGLGDEDLVRRMSQGHRRSLKKARGLGLTTALVEDEAGARAFAGLHETLYRSRGLAIDGEVDRADVLRRFEFARKSGRGFLMGVYDDAGAFRGGVLIARERQRAFYDMGCTDPSRRDLPLLHLCMHAAMRHAASLGCTEFDLGGYGHLAQAEDQVGKINEFKARFGGEHVFYTRPLVFELRPRSLRLFRAANLARTRVRDLLAQARAARIER